MGLLRSAWLGACLAAFAAANAGCSCNNKPPPNACPASLHVGDSCSVEKLTCPWPESKCNSAVCTCKSGTGGLYWTCASSWCNCTCPCGYTAAVSCDSLDCNAQPEDPCPSDLSAYCDVVCQPPDGGRPDARRDKGGDSSRDLPPSDSRLDAPRDLRHDGRKDAPADRTID